MCIFGSAGYSFTESFMNALHVYDCGNVMKVFIYGSTYGFVLSIIHCKLRKNQ